MPGSFASIYERAAARKGGEQELAALAAVSLKSPAQLAKIDDSRYLSAMTKAIFRAGFVWKVIDNKWPNFEKAFWKFNVMRCAMMSPDDVEALSRDTSIVRNPQKINTVPANAAMILDAARQYGSFANMIAQWRDDDFIGLLAYLNKQGSRLGGNSAQYFLREMGKDGFILSRDGVAALIGAGVVDAEPKSKKALAQVQDAYNHWRQETGFGNAKISRILAMSVGD
ncbi:MAG: DNA-3-methyladenine glycosylase I [Porticoccaceae bacterium]